MSKKANGTTLDLPDFRKRELTVYVSVNLLSHPKMLRAAAMVKPFGLTRAVTMYLAGLGYARAQLTDGFIPSAIIDSFVWEKRPKKVAGALAAAGLWQRERVGWSIHDYLDWNYSAARVKEIRAKTADRARRFRERHA